MNNGKTPKSFSLIIGGKDDCFRRGFFEILRKSSLIEIKSCAKDIDQALELIAQEQCNVALLNENMTGINGKCTVSAIKEKFPLTKVFVVSTYYSVEQLHELKAKGVNGFLLITANKKEIEEAFLSSEKIFYSNEIYKQIMETTTDLKLKQILTDREQDVFWLLIKGKDVKSISEALSISPATVYDYRESVFTKTDAENDAQLLIWALKNNIVTVEDMMKW